jgi:acetyltransferase-like isoleucine patch superfamily enzyme
MNKYLSFLSKVNLKSVYFNFKYLSIKQAMKMPVLVSKYVKLKEVRGRVIISGEVTTGMIKIGYGDIAIFDRERSRSIWQVSGCVYFKGKANIGHGSKISVRDNASLTFGRHFIMTAESTIVAHKKIEFGDNCMISWETLFMDTDLHQIKSNIDGEVINSPKEIIIGNDVWIGCRTVVLKGSKIGNNAVVGACSVVTKDISKASGIFVGNPVRLLKQDITWTM